MRETFLRGSTAEAALQSRLTNAVGGQTRHELHWALHPSDRRTHHFLAQSKEEFCIACHTSASRVGVDKPCHGHVLPTTAIAIPFILCKRRLPDHRVPPPGSLLPKTNTMAGHFNGAWHNMHGNGLPYRPPPTVDEAIPYSPFTSIIPFSLGQYLNLTETLLQHCSLTCYRSVC